MSTSAYLQSLADRINAVDTCSGLQEVSNEVKQAIADKIAAIEKNISSMASSEQLIVPPTDLVTAINWMKNFIESDIMPIYRAYQASIQELQATEQALVNITQAVENKASQFLNCEII